MSFVDDELVRALQRISRAIDYLGNGNAATEVGAIKGHSMKLSETGEHMATAISDAALQISNALEEVAKGLGSIAYAIERYGQPPDA